MTTTSWHKLFGLGASVALVAVACTVSSGSDDDDGVTTGVGGSGGSDAGGSGGTDATGGTDASGGSAGDPGTTTTTTTTTTTGSGGSGGSPEMVECLMEDDGAIPGTPGSCDIEDADPCCTRCVKTNCCDSYGDCFASEPNICGGSTDENSEIMAFINCMLAIEDGATPGMDDDSDLVNCMAQAVEEVSWICDAGAPSGPTNELATCMHGDMDGLDGCFFECLDSNFEESECVY